MSAKFLVPVLYWIDENRWLLVAALVSVVLYFVPPPAGLSLLGWRVINIAAAVIILIVTEPLPLPAIALFIAIMQVLFGIGTPSHVASSFLSDAVLFIIGSLMLAVVIVHQKLDRRLAYLIVKITGVKIDRITLGFVLVSSIVASFIGEHTVAAVMLPVAISLIRFVEEEQGKETSQGLAPLLLFAIAYGCAIGALGTPSGGARNAIMIDLWNRLYHEQMTYGRWIIYAYPLGLLHLPFLIWILRRTFYPERASLSRAVIRLRQKMSDQGGLSSQEYMTLGVFGVAFFLWIFFSDKIGLGVPALIAVFLALVLHLVEWKHINNGVNWGVVFIYASTISLGVAFNQTGAGEWVANQIELLFDMLGLHYQVVMIGVVALTTMLLANLMGHGPALALIGPIALIISENVGIDSITAGFMTVAASSYSYMTVIGSPAGNIVYSSGELKTSDYLKAGIKMTLVSVTLIYFMRYTYWALLN